MKRLTAVLAGAVVVALFSWASIFSGGSQEATIEPVALEGKWAAIMAATPTPSPTVTPSPTTTPTGTPEPTATPELAPVWTWTPTSTPEPVVVVTAAAEERIATPVPALRSIDTPAPRPILSPRATATPTPAPTATPAPTPRYSVHVGDLDKIEDRCEILVLGMCGGAAYPNLRA